MFQFPTPGFPIGGVADPGRYSPPLPPLGGRAQPSPPPPPPAPSDYTDYRRIDLRYEVDSSMLAVPVILTNKARPLINLNNREELIQFIQDLQWTALYHYEEDYYQSFYGEHPAHFITYIAREGDAYFFYRRHYIDLLHPILLFPIRAIASIFEVVGIDNPETGERIFQFRTIDRYNPRYYRCETPPTWLRHMFEIEDGGSVLIYAPFTLLGFEARDDFSYTRYGNHIDTWRDFQPDTPFNWESSIYAPYIRYFIEKNYTVITEVYPSFARYIYERYEYYQGDSYHYSAQEDAQISPSLLASGWVDLNGQYRRYENLPYPQLWFYEYYKHFFPAEAVGRYILNAGHITFDKPQAKLVLVVQAGLNAPLRSEIKRMPCFHVFEQITSTAKFSMSCNIQRKPSFVLQEELTAKAQVRLRINILPYFRTQEIIKRIPRFQLTEFIFRLYSSARFPLHINIYGRAEGAIEQNVERKYLVPIFTRIQNRCSFPVRETTTRKPFFILSQKHISSGRVRLIVKVKTPPPHFRLTLKVNSRCRKPIHIRCWRYERPIRNLAYYRYYNIAIS